MEHTVNDLLHCRLQAWTFPAGIEARWLGEGILQLLPTAPWRRATILSAGVHGNETAPIELLLQLTHDLSRGRQPLTQALLIVFGNLPAIRAARRYLHNDLNRLFGGRHLAVTPGNESRRAFALEQAVQAFIAPPMRRGRSTVVISICTPPFADRCIASLRCSRPTPGIFRPISISCCRPAGWTPSCAIPKRAAPSPISPAKSSPRKAPPRSWGK